MVLKIPKPKVTIIILNYNGWQDTINCLDSIFRINYSNWEIILVDNGSQDESISKFVSWAKIDSQTKVSNTKGGSVHKSIEKSVYNEKKCEIEFLNNYNELNHKKSVLLIEAKKNYGFAGGNNIAINYILKNRKTKYILLLNNDVIVDKDFLDILIMEGEKNPKIGVLGPLVHNFHDPLCIQSAGFKINWKKGEQIVYHQNELDIGLIKKRDVDAISGCAFLAKIETFKEAGLFKQKYFAYWEETEWCIRIKKLSYKVVNIPQAKVWHKEASTSSKMVGFLEYYLTRNLLWLIREHAPKKKMNIFLLYFFSYKIFQLCAFLIKQNKNLKIIPYYLKGVWDGLFKDYE